MKILAFDTETYPIRPGAIAPKLVCASFAMRLDGEAETVLVGNGDAGLREHIWWMLSEPGLRVVGQNIAFDLAVICAAYPEFEPAVWAKLEAGEITDTSIREKLLNLSTHGNLESVQGAKISYALDALVLKYLGRDISADKEGEDQVLVPLPAGKPGDQPEYRAVVMDFGLAKERRAGPELAKLTATGIVLGTPEFMSPEQIRGKPLDGRSDVYALGVLAFELFTGQLPFPGKSAQETMIARLRARSRDRTA